MEINSFIFFDLPNDIWSIIVNDLHKTDINNLYRTNKTFNEYVCRWMELFHICDCKLLPLQKCSINGAARNGYLEVIKWLYENHTEGCIFDAMILAARNGHLPIVKWLHENHTEYTVAARALASRNKHAPFLYWLYENRTEGCTVRAMNWAGKMFAYCGMFT
jgi:hypothetical protein